MNIGQHRLGILGSEGHKDSGNRENRESGQQGGIECFISPNQVTIYGGVAYSTDFFKEIGKLYLAVGINGVYEAFLKEEKSFENGGRLNNAVHRFMVSNARLEGVKSGKGVKGVDFYLGICKKGFNDIKSLDGGLTKIILASVAGSEEAKTYLQELSLGIMLLEDEKVREGLVASINPEQAYNVLLNAYMGPVNSSVRTLHH